MRLVLDQGVPRDAADMLRSSGADCVHVSEIGLSKAEDEDILEHVLGRGAILVTLDADFHAALAVRRASHPSVIRIRIQGLDADAIATLVKLVIADFATELKDGAAVTVRPRKIACHRLPMGGQD
jgi:predicted nuclease of predicted toxin-antitoxin system